MEAKRPFALEVNQSIGHSSVDDLSALDDHPFLTVGNSCEVLHLEKVWTAAKPVLAVKSDSVQSSVLLRL